MRKLRIYAATMLALGALVASALPASAAGVGVFTGQAGTCALFFPGLSVNPAECTPGYTFSASTIVAVDDGVPATISFSVSGDLGAVANAPVVGNLGPWCGLSQGYNGSGPITSTGPSGSGTLSHVGWLASAGGTLPVTGHWSADSGSANGTLIALVQAQGGADCAGSGATTFDVVGVSALV